MPPLELLRAAAAEGIDYVGVTDHGTIRGGVEAALLAEDDEDLPRVIIGQEVFTTQGEVIGLYLVEDIPSGLTLDQTVSRIQGQGGLVYLPHPYDAVRRATIHAGVLERAAAHSDVIEVVNGRSLRRAFDRSAKALAERHQTAGGAGSDAHYPGEVGRAVCEVAGMPTRDDLVALLRDGRCRRRGGAGLDLLALWYLVRVGVDKVRGRFGWSRKG
jgi:predicted metal-dependent phosphoesterase TrpH